MLAHYCRPHRMIVILLAVWLMPGVTLAQDAAASRIATVNGKDILRSDLDRELKLIQLKLAHQGRTLTESHLRRYTGEIRETLINRTLLQARADAEGIRASGSQVKRALDIFQSGFADEAEYRQALAEMGFSEAMLTEQIKNGLAIKSLIDRVVIQRIHISDQKARSYYNEHPDLFRRPAQVRASHILIKVSSGADAAQKAASLGVIQGLKARIDAGEDFATLAMDYSNCPSKANGGDLGFFDREQMAPAFTDAAFALDTGRVSDVVETRFGYHLIKVTDRKAPQTMGFAEVKAEIIDRLRQEQEEKRIGNYLEKLKKGADIKRFPL